MTSETMLRNHSTERYETRYEISQLLHLPENIRSIEIDIRNSICADGYTRVDRTFAEYPSGGDLENSRREFLKSIEKLPKDPDCNLCNRERRFGIFYYFPWTGELESEQPEWDSSAQDYVIKYQQSVDLNSEARGKNRTFAALQKNQTTNLFLRSLIYRCFRVLPWRERGAVIVQVHVIRLLARENAFGFSNPDHLHRDGQPFTWAFLLDRNGVIGGENFIAKTRSVECLPHSIPPSDILARFTLENPFEGWVVDDRRVSHYVSPVGLDAGHVEGQRTVLLIDFSRAIAEEIH